MVRPSLALRSLVPAALALGLLAAAPLHAQVPAAESSTAGRAARELAHYELRMDRVRAAFRANQLMAQAVDADPALRDRLSASADAGQEVSLDALASRLSDEPQLAAALHTAGISAREHALLTLALMQASLAFAMQEQNPRAVLPEEVNPKNVAFIRSHQTELKQLAGADRATRR